MPWSTALSEVRAPSEKPPGEWRRLGVERLQRSLRKVALETGTAFDADGWRELSQAYDEAPAVVSRF